MSASAETPWPTTVEEFLKVDLDEWTRRIVARHFHPETGSPFWLARRARLPFDPLSITTYAELERFGPFPMDEMTSCDPRDLVPLANPRPLTGQIWDSGGTTGTPKRLYYTEALMAEREVWREYADHAAGFEDGKVWLNAMPTGPHFAGTPPITAARAGKAFVYGIDMDPRWVKRMLRQGRPADAREYTDHILEQIVEVLSTREVDYLATSPALMQALCRQHPTALKDVRGVRMSGTQITPRMFQEYRDVVGEDFIILRRYGNTMADAGMGLGVEEGGAILPYRTAYPFTTMRIVDPDDWRSPVEDGVYGQVCVTVLHPDHFLPNMLERDEALRRPVEGWPVDGVANVRPLIRTRASAPEGIY